MAPDYIGYIVRAAQAADLKTLVAFTLEEAHEAEGLSLEPGAVRRGIAAAFDDPPRVSYWVIETAGSQLVASASVVTEWSNFHGGEYWWIQSLFIKPEHRSHGVLELLLGHVRSAAAAAGALDLRLYAHTANERALRAYARCGFVAAPYVIMQQNPRL